MDLNPSTNLVLPRGLSIEAISELSEERKQNLKADASEYVVTRRYSRARSKIISSQLAGFLGEFSQESTVTDAVLRYSARENQDPETVLEQVYPHIQQFVADRLLVPEGSAHQEEVSNSLETDDDWAGYKIVSLQAITEDTEVYKARARDGALIALKIAREETNMASQFKREAKILELITPSIAPALIECDDFENRAYIAMQWCAGDPLPEVAAIYRSHHVTERSRLMLPILKQIVRSYAALHRCGVIHGDVHPGNLVVECCGAVRLVDFGSARVPASDNKLLNRCSRAAVGYYYEPEFAAAYHETVREAPQSSYLGEQHIVAHLLYAIVTGQGFADFPLERNEGMRALADSTMRAFREAGTAEWPALESILQRALAKEPSNRYQNLSELLGELETIKPPAVVAAGEETLQRQVSVPNDYLEYYLHAADPKRSLFTRGYAERPFSSINYGSAGMAYFLYRYALLTCSPTHLSWSKLWIEKAIAEFRTDPELAFTAEEGQINRDVIGNVAIYHTQSGLYLTQALVSKALDDRLTLSNAINNFMHATVMPSVNQDVTLGNSGVLIALSILLDTARGETSITQRGDFYFEHLSKWLIELPEISSCDELTSLGVAHGWAGILYALLLWCQASRQAVPGWLDERLMQFASLAEQFGDQIRWPSKLDESDLWSRRANIVSWCNGGAGIIFLWTLAYELTGNKDYRLFAESLGRTVYNAGSRLNQICCGRPGQAFAMLNLFKCTREDQWLACAKSMLVQSLSDFPSDPDPSAEFFYSLYKGPLGSALLSVDLENPEYSCMPLFELEQYC